MNLDILSDKKKFCSIEDNDKNYIVWICLVGYIIVYTTAFIYPTFLGSENTTDFNPYKQSGPYIKGADLRLMLGYCKSVFVEGKTPYVGTNPYPPFSFIFFAPFLLFDFITAYRIVTVISLASYIVTTVVVPTLIYKNFRVHIPFTILFFVTGLHSYGFQFELAMGQFNIIAFTFCLLGVYLYHRDKKYEILACVLFSVSIQLKLYPAIFLILFFGDCSNWKLKLKNILFILILNLILFFILGYETFCDFILTTKNNMSNPVVFGTLNHSIRSFLICLTLAEGKFGLPWLLSAMLPYKWFLEILLFLFVCFCLLVIILRSLKQSKQFSSDINPFLLLGCTIAGLVIPSISNDYTLPILASSMTIFVSGISFRWYNEKKTLIGGVILIASMAYFMTLFPWFIKPVILMNNMPMLIVILAAATVLCFDMSHWPQRKSSYE